MRILDWLKRRPTWLVSEGGNPIIQIRNLRVTVIEDHGRWRYCVAVGEDDSSSYLSDEFLSMEKAKAAALEDLRQ